MKKTMFIVLMILILAFASMAIAAPTGGNITASGAQDRGTGSTSESLTTEGGNLTEINVSGTSITSNWAGFYGNLAGGIELSDSSSNKFFEWTVTDMTGAVVYATNAAVSDWSGATIQPATNTDMPAYINSAGTDNFTNTYDSTEAFVSASLNEANTPYVTTFDSTGNPGNLKSYALTDTSALIWAGLAVNNDDAFNGGVVDYQILVPADNSGQQYNFYLELQ